MSLARVIECLSAGEMDYVGQKNAYDLQCLLIYAFCGLGFVYGFFHDSFAYCFYGSLLGAALSVLMCFPSWPCYNRDPLTWQPAADRERFAYDNDEEYFNAMKED
eukprot:g3367.t1